MELYENKKPQFRNRGFCCGPIGTSGSTKSSYFSIGDTPVQYFIRNYGNADHHVLFPWEMTWQNYKK